MLMVCIMDGMYNGIMDSICVMDGMHTEWCIMDGMHNE